MSLAFDSYVPGASFLHRLDPRVKLWCLLLGSVALFLVPALLPLLGFLIAWHLLLLAAGISWRALARLWKQMGILILLILVLNPLIRSEGTALLTLGPLRLTVEGLQYAALLATRTLTLGFLLAALMFTTANTDLVRGLVRLGLPYSWGLTLSLTLRFLPAIQSLFWAVQEAQAARGWVPSGGLVRRLRSYFPILVAVIVGTLRLSDQLTLALIARGLSSSGRRTVWRDLKMQPADWFALALSTLAFFVLVLWRSGMLPG